LSYFKGDKKKKRQWDVGGKNQSLKGTIGYRKGSGGKERKKGGHNKKKKANGQKRRTYTIGSGKPAHTREDKNAGGKDLEKTPRDSSFLRLDLCEKSPYGNGGKRNNIKKR